MAVIELVDRDPNAKKIDKPVKKDTKEKPNEAKVDPKALSK